MSRMNAIFAALVVAAVVAVVPSAKAAAPDGLVVASGSSAMWQSVALAAFNHGNCATANVKVTPPCKHWTGSTKLNMEDQRPALVPSSRGGPGTNTTDAGNTWVVWDSAATPHYWLYVNVDSTIGNRCFFAVPQCKVIAPAGDTYAISSPALISTVLWGPDSALPTSIQDVLNTGVLVNAGASDIRAEDALFATCRANSKLGNGDPGFGDGTDGLGYNDNNASGTCVQYETKVGTKTVFSTLAELLGNSVETGYPGSTSSFHVNAFEVNDSTTALDDPFTGKATLTKTGWTTIDVGIDPIVFVFSRSGGQLAGLKNASDSQLQAVFSGTDCDASEFGLAAAPIYAYLREPLSGTYNTTEATVMRRPTETVPDHRVIGLSFEAKTAGVNPLKSTPCASGRGFRSRAIGTGQEVQSVQDSVTNNSLDGIGFAFFSFGNVSPLAASANYGYITLDGVDPIAIPGTVNQELPGATTVCKGKGFPCSEAQIWGTSNLSFPNVRSGSYSAWSLLRWVTSVANEVNVKDLLNASEGYVVSSTPDYIPAQAQPIGCSVSARTCRDPGVRIFHTHYQQLDGDGKALGAAPGNGTFNANGNPTGGDVGGDMGGCIKSTPLSGDFNFIQIGPGDGCSNAAVR
jgi:hypothetical protein